MTAIGSINQARAKRKRPLRTDHAFLPAALEILETPPAPLAGVMIGVICLFFVAALGWSYIGRMDVIAVAQGKVQPTGRVKTIQSLRAGRVLELNVDNGTRVHKGDLLLRLDPREARAERDGAASELEGWYAETARRKTALAITQSTNGELPTITFPTEVPKFIAEREQRILAADASALRARIERLDGEAAQKAAERQKLIDTIAAQQGLIGVLRERVSMRQTLVDRAAGTRADLLEGMEDLTTQQATLAQEVGQVKEIEAGLKVIDRERREAIAGFRDENAQKLGDAERQVAILRQRLARAEAELDQTLVKSPIDGIVQASSLTTLGQVVNPGEELMRIVPDGAGIEIQCYLPNKDIGFVKQGQRAIIKIESFPFTRYGTIEADVVRVAEDAIPEPDATQTEQDPTHTQRLNARAGADRIQNLVYPVTLRPKQLALRVGETSAPLRAGMAVTAEIKTTQRRLIDYLLSPIEGVGSEALKER